MATAEEACALPSVPLDVNECLSCRHTQLGVVVDAPQLFRDYLYVSGTSSIFRAHFRDYARSMMEWVPSKRALVVDVGSNDGTLLSSFADLGCEIQGVDPAQALAEQASANGIPTLPDFFDDEARDWILANRGMADVVTANNVCAHVDDLRGLVGSVAGLLKPSGVFSFEVSYLLDVEESLLFDTIYHEHLDYHAVAPLVPFLESCDLTLVDVQPVASHGGSIRCIAARSDSGIRPRRDRIETFLDREASDRTRSDLAGFPRRIGQLEVQFARALSTSTQDSNRAWGFGAPAKATTLMYQLGLGARSLAMIIDDSPIKVGRFMPGSGIPIISASALEGEQPGKIVILAWNFAGAIIDRLKQEYKFQGAVAVPLPEFDEFNLN